MKRKIFGLLAVGTAVLAMPLAAQKGGVDLLGKLQSGMWEVRERGSDSKQRICVRSGRELIQLRHRGSECNRFVVEEAANEVTVQYNCRGKGYGRTAIRRENAGLVQIQSQGIEGGLPFEFTAEARRVGSC